VAVPAGLSQLQQGFLWAAKDATTGAKCLVNWTVVASPRSIGELGITNIQFQSNALLGFGLPM
jgi:hypothetical protein